ncbi:MAG: heme o synthase [Leptospiraceae bacterium]|nr:heme o synthase [Leptospiraceae bacterium]
MILKYIRIWLALTKPRVTSLVLVTALPGIYLGSEEVPSFSFLFYVLLGTFFMSSASFVFNQIIERDKDAEMERTKNRPLPKKEISVFSAALGGILLIILSFIVFYFYVNLLAFYCALFGFLTYVFLYTILLKPRTDQNIVIGGVAGCVGPLIGFAATTNSIPIAAWTLFTMIFLWTPAHFWSLAIFLNKDYGTANFPMMPVQKGIPKTTKAILLYSILYSASCVFFYFTTDKIGYFYLIPTSLLCLLMLYYSIQLVKTNSEIEARKFFFFSIFHLFLVNIFILADYTIHLKG